MLIAMVALPACEMARKAAGVEILDQKPRPAPKLPARRWGWKRRANSCGRWPRCRWNFTSVA
jgi:hypothetical protein